MTQQYIGRKQVTAWPSRIEKCNCEALNESARAAGQPDRAGCSNCGKPARDGYGVKYADGYTSWSPKDTFEEAYIRLGHIEHLPPFHQRLFGEHALLDADVQALDKFMDTPAFAELTPEHATLLQMQLEAMFRYRDLLEQRLELLGTPRTRRPLNPPAVATGD